MKGHFQDEYLSSFCKLASLPLTTVLIFFFFRSFKKVSSPHMGIPFYVLSLKEMLKAGTDWKYESHLLLGNH